MVGKIGIGRQTILKGLQETERARDMARRSVSIEIKRKCNLTKGSN